MTNQYWTTLGDRYDYNFYNKSENINVTGSEDQKSISCSIPAGYANSENDCDWYSVLAVSPKMELGIGEGMSIIFRLNRAMKFGDFNGYNGMVSFCWANPSARFLNTADFTVPHSLHFSVYDSRNLVDDNLDMNYRGGGYGTLLGGTSAARGISLTLFPDEGTSPNDSTPPNGSLHEGTTRVSCYKVTYKNAASPNMSMPIKGYLPKSVDLSADTTLFINSSFGYYHIYINGMKICDIPVVENTDPNDLYSLIDQCKFGMCAMGAWNSPVDFEIKNLTYVDKIYDMATYE